MRSPLNGNCQCSGHGLNTYPHHPHPPRGKYRSVPVCSGAGDCFHDAGTALVLDESSFGRQFNRKPLFEGRRLHCGKPGMVLGVKG